MRAQGRRFEGLDDREWKGSFMFVQMADTQLGMLHADKSWDEELEMMQVAVDHINQLRPEFVIVCGDLVNAFPDGGAVKERAQAQQVADYKLALGRVDESIPLLCVCGNHDLGNTPTRATIDLYRQRFGDDYFQFWVRGLQGLVLNSQVYKDDTHTTDVRAEQTEWLHAALKEGGSPKHRVVFSHIPPFITAADEPDGYFNLDRQTRSDLLRVTKAAGVRKWFCGHYHRNAGAVDPDGLECIITAAVGTNLTPSGVDPLGLNGFVEPLKIGLDKSGMRLVKVQADGIQHKWFTLDSVPESCDACSSSW